MHSAVNGHPRCCSRLVARPRCRRLPARWPPTASRASTPLPPARPARPHRARPLKRSSAGAAACASLAGKSQSRGGPDCLRSKRVLCAPESRPPAVQRALRRRVEGARPTPTRLAPCRCPRSSLKLIFPFFPARLCARFCPRRGVSPVRRTVDHFRFAVDFRSTGGGGGRARGGAPGRARLASRGPGPLPFTLPQTALFALSSLSPSLTVPLSHSLTLSLSHSLTHSLSLSYSLTHSLSPPPPSLSLSLSPSLSPSLSRSLALSLSLSLALALAIAIALALLLSLLLSLLQPQCAGWGRRSASGRASSCGSAQMVPPTPPAPPSLEAERTRRVQLVRKEGTRRVGGGGGGGRKGTAGWLRTPVRPKPTSGVGLNGGGALPSTELAGVLARRLLRSAAAVLHSVLRLSWVRRKLRKAGALSGPTT